MSTRANIGYKTEHGSYRMIYCHYDGYPRHVGRILVEHFTTMDHVKNILNGKQIRQFNEDGTFERFEDGGGAVYEADLNDALYGYDYAYVFDDGRWRCFQQELFGIKEIKLV